jgi:hypothetical protein
MRVVTLIAALALAVPVTALGWGRTYPPWKALTRGTKRWATYAGACAKTAARRLVPGDERLKYRVNPGEGFAEAFRVLNELRAGLAGGAYTIDVSRP